MTHHRRVKGLTAEQALEYVEENVGDFEALKGMKSYILKRQKDCLEDLLDKDSLRFTVYVEFAEYCTDYSMSATVLKPLTPKQEAAKKAKTA